MLLQLARPLLALMSIATVTAQAPGAHRRHHRDLIARQGQGRPVMTDEWWLNDPNNPSSTGGEAPSGSGPTTALTSGLTTSAAPTTSAPSPTGVAPTTQPTSAPASNAAPSPSTASPSPSPASASAVSPSVSTITETSSFSTPSSVSVIQSLPSSSSSSSSSLSVATSSRSSTSTVTSIRTISGASPSATSLPSDNNEGESKGGLSRTALIVIIVISSVVGAAAIGWTLFRKWKLRPSNRFDDKMRPIDFSPQGRGGMDDDFIEKTLHRSASNASADRQRQALVAELDTTGTGGNPNHVPGVPDHDFTAGYAGAGAGVGAYGAAGGAYGADPFAPGATYDDYYAQQSTAHGYPPAQAQAQAQYDQYGRPYEYPTQDGAEPVHGVHAQEYGYDDGYADLKRGNSTGAGAGGAGAYSHSPTSAAPLQQHQQPHQAYDFPDPGSYLGRPTGGSDGPYAQAAQYRY